MLERKHSRVYQVFWRIAEIVCLVEQRRLIARVVPRLYPGEHGEGTVVVLTPLIEHGMRFAKLTLRVKKLACTCQIRGGVNVEALLGIDAIDLWGGVDDKCVAQCDARSRDVYGLPALDDIGRFIERSKSSRLCRPDDGGKQKLALDQFKTPQAKRIGKPIDISRPNQGTINGIVSLSRR